MDGTNQSCRACGGSGTILTGDEEITCRACGGHGTKAACDRDPPDWQVEKERKI